MAKVASEGFGASSGDGIDECREQVVPPSLYAGMPLLNSQSHFQAHLTLLFLSSCLVSLVVQF
jgi:hypothetical protein